jgi:hypothetical protein|tara:strand:+ start:167 stop:565 length:399 start_codon:yes stop_codon:yes gene_type:complete
VTRTIAFRGDYDWGTQPGGFSNRPYSEVEIVGPNGSISAFCIVDSGADYMQLPKEILEDIGIDIPDDKTTVLDASLCNVIFEVFYDVEVVIEGKKTILDKVLSNPGVPPLLGRTAFLQVLDVGFDDDGWLHK